MKIEEEYSRGKEIEMRFLLAGGRGFIGAYLAAFLRAQGSAVITLSRERGEGNEVWNPERGELDPDLLAGCDVVVNLCGESILGRWTPRKKRAIAQSRLTPTRLLCQTIASLSSPPPLYIGISAIGYYGDRGQEKVTEEDIRGEGFLSSLCVQWEEIPYCALLYTDVRIVHMRLGIVLGPSGGFLEGMRKIYRCGLGGRWGGGEQIMSWIAIDDLCQILYTIAQEKSYRGALNLTTPQAVTNSAFTKSMGKILSVPTLCALPTWALRLIWGESADLFLSSTYAYPQVLVEKRYPFLYPTLEGALEKYLQVRS